MEGMVLGFGFTNDNRVALIRKIRPDWQRGSFNGVGGHIEPGESPVDAMVREFMEETGVKIDKWHWTQFAKLIRLGC